MMMTSISNEATKTIANLANTRIMKQRARKSNTSSIRASILGNKLGFESVLIH